ncbi:MAG: ferrous iron transport protein B [Clostridia bacterium]|nr:ferrous iron transport protein B [Clostridia bacterium]
MAEIKIALAGNPNSGKTTLFNALTGSNQFVGNWPGVTVEKKEGRLKKSDGVTVVDLPGIYSLSPYTPEEIVARSFLVGERPDVILNIVDGTNLERNLYLTTQLIELGIPVVIAINMMDVVNKAGDKIDIERLSKELGCKIVEISALKETGIAEAADVAIAAASEGATGYQPFFSGIVEHALAHIEEAAVHERPQAQQRWYSLKIFERDQKVLEELKLDKKILDHIEADITAVEKNLDDDAESIIINERYLYVESVLSRCYTRKNKGKLSVSDRIDRILTNRILALPIFAVIMFLVYYISVSTVGSWATAWVGEGIFGDGNWNFFGLSLPGIPQLITNALPGNCPPWLSSLILNGIVAGVGGVLSFVPQILVLFLMLSFLEACGYMSRIAFLMDKIFRKFGLSGKSFIPILVGTGCGVPGIMASRTIENEKDRRMTVITTTFIPCSAKLPIIAMIAANVFGGAWWVAPSAYFAGIAAIVVSGIMLKKTKLFASETTPFVMELPAYHMPTFGNVMRATWERGWSFIKKAGTVILLSTIVIWTLSRFGVTANGFGFDVDMADKALENSILGMIGKGVAWIFAPLGFGDLETVVATLMGLMAKEEVVAVLDVLGYEGFTNNHLAGYSFLIFNLLCAPCFAAMGAIAREMNSAKWTAFAIGYQCAFAYTISLIIYQIGLAATGAMNIPGFIAALAVMAFMLVMIFRKGKKI